MVPSLSSQVGMITVPRNPLTSKWDTLFEKDPKEWIAFKPDLGLHVYPCYSCRHMFYSKKSFQFHVNRRAVLLLYKCPGCSDKDLTFYNRCALLLHARKHYTLDQGYVNLNKLEIKSLPMGLAGFCKTPDIPYLFDVEEEYIEDETFINAQFYAPKYDDRGKDVITLTPSNLVINKVGSNGETQALSVMQIANNIPKCKFVTVDFLNNLMKQFATSQEQVEVKTELEDEEDTEVISETLSDLMLPVIAKIESLDEPFSLDTSTQICPECEEHVADSLAIHFIGDNRPGDPNLKCYVCRLICTTPCSYSAHIRIHNQIPPHICPDCGENFKEYSELQDHMEDVCYHLSKSIRYRCPGRKCSKLFAMAQTYISHFSVHMDNLYQCGSCRAVFDNVKVAEAHSQTHSPPCEVTPCFDCTVCTMGSNLNRAGCTKHIEWHMNDLSKCIYIYICKYCKSYFRSTATYGTHLIKCAIRKNGVPKKNRMNGSFMLSKYCSGECKVCKNRIIFSKTSPVDICSKCIKKQEEPERDVEENYKCVCVLCKKSMLIAERKRHQVMCRYANPTVIVEKINLKKVRASLSSSSSSDLDSTLSSIEAKDASESKPKKRKFIRPKRIETVLDLTADKPIEFDGTYQCRICDITETDRDRFHEHIRSHRQESTAYQCMECGECFVVRPSLVIHLLHYHNIADHETYFKDNSCFDQSAVEKLAKVVKLPHYMMRDDVKENQCKVCLEEFSDKEKLDKHFRVHGMAFLLKNSV